MAKRNLSKKPKRKQLSRKLKRKTLNRKKVGKGGNRGGGMPYKDNDNEIGAMIMSVFSLLIFLVYLKVLKDTASQEVEGGGSGLNNDLYNSLLNNKCLNQDSKIYKEFYKEFKTLYDKVEITKDYDLIIKDEELLKILLKNKFLNEHITGKEIHIKNMSKDNIIHEINLLYPNQDLLDIDCINEKVEKLNKTPTL
jgi:hypothetical protein